MPNGIDTTVEYAKHDYPEFKGASVECKHGCGCWISGSRSDGPLGLDPSPYGMCPNNPVDGQGQHSIHGKDGDYRAVVKIRIKKLEEAASELDRIKKELSKSHRDLIDERDDLRRKLRLANSKLGSIGIIAQDTISLILDS